MMIQFVEVHDKLCDKSQNDFDTLSKWRKGVVVAYFEAQDNENTSDFAQQYWY